MARNEDHSKAKDQPTIPSALYFEDGDIVVTANDSRGQRHMCRVDRVILTRSSSIFADVFAIPQEQSYLETYEGAPLVHLTDDADDVIGLLQVLYDPSQLIPSDGHSPKTPVNAHALLEMSRKYDIPWIRKAVEHNLKADWPNTLEAYRLSHRSEKSIMQSLRKLPDPALAIRLGTDFDIEDILPAAFLTLVRQNTNARQGDNGTASSTEMDAASHPDFSCAIDWSLLRTEDWLRFSRGKDHLSHWIRDMLGTIKGNMFRHPQCSGGEQCRQELRVFCGVYDNISTPTFFLQPNPVGIVQLWQDAICDYGLCNHCHAHFLTFVEKQMSDLWDGLSEVFELEDNCGWY